MPRHVSPGILDTSWTDRSKHGYGLSLDDAVPGARRPMSFARSSHVRRSILMQAPQPPGRSLAANGPSAQADSGLRRTGPAVGNVPRRDLDAARRAGGVDGNKRMLGVAR